MAVAERKLPLPALALCLGLVWVVWGTTYLAIRVAIETLPPLLMAGVRFLVAGSLLGGFALLRGAARPTPRQVVHASGLGLLFFCMGNGLVTLAETRISSGAAALLVAIEPVFVVLFSLRRPALLEVGGMLFSTVGLVLLVGSPDAASADPMGAALVLFASVGWAFASVKVRTADLPASPALAAGLEMLAGGVALTAAGLVRGEAFDPARVTAASLGAFAYLVVFGSIVAFSAYQVLARSVSPALTATYAYVNPVVAVVAGVLLGGEVATQRSVLAGATIVAGVVLITGAPLLQRRRVAAQAEGG